MDELLKEIVDAIKKEKLVIFSKDNFVKFIKELPSVIYFKHKQDYKIMAGISHAIMTSLTTISPRKSQLDYFLINKNGDNYQVLADTYTAFLNLINQYHFKCKKINKNGIICKIYS